MTKNHIALFGPEGEIRAGHYIATATVDSARRYLFFSMPGKERHLATIISGSRSKLLQFDLDMKRRPVTVRGENRDTFANPNYVADTPGVSHRRALI